MNLELLSTGQTYPDAIDSLLEGQGFAVTVCFNRHGTLLAAGCNDGRVVLWDFDTRLVARTLEHHVLPVTAVMFSRSGRRLVSSSYDKSVCVWDVESETIFKTFDFDCPVHSVVVNSRKPHFLACCTESGEPFLLNVDTGSRRRLDPDVHTDNNNGEERVLQQAHVAVFDRKGIRVYVGTVKGKIHIFDVETLEVYETIDVANNAAIKSIFFDRKGSTFVVNSTDRIVRTFAGDTHELTHRFQDLVNRVHWKKLCFSGQGEYLVGGSAQKAQHNVYIWDTATAQLVKILEGPKEALIDVVWHPVRPIIVSVSNIGVIYIWTINYTENWSAFAPDFQELEENQEYIEREDEFDIIDDAEMKKKVEEEEDVEVDICHVDTVAAFASTDDDDDDEPPLTYIAVNPGAGRD